MKKIVKLVPIMLLAIMLLSVFSPVMAAARESSISTPADVTVTKTDKFNTIGGKIIGMIQAIGNIVSVAVLVILGIKYMMGSAEEKAEYKKTMIPYLVGAILIFAASNIAGMVANFAQTVK